MTRAAGFGGDPAAKRQFECSMAEAAHALFRTGHLMTGNAEAAEDLVQETFLWWRVGGTGCGRWIIWPPMPAGF